MNKTIGFNSSLRSLQFSKGLHPLAKSYTVYYEIFTRDIHLNDVLFHFPDGSLTHPDIAILSRQPNHTESTKALTIVPEAVIEIVSEGYEKKDLELAPSFYLSTNVKDVIIFEPSTLIVYHYRKDGSKRLGSPVEIRLECGCTCTV